MTEPGAASQAARIRSAKLRRRRLINIGLVVVALAVIAYVVISRRGGSKTSADLITATVARGDLVQAVSATGSVTAQTGAQIKIGAQITGTIKHLYADLGGHVRAGQVIAELYLPNLDAQVQQAQASLTKSQRALVEQQSGVGLQAVQTRTSIDTAKATLASAQASLEEAKAAEKLDVANAESSLRQAQANERNSTANFARVQQLFQKGYVAAADVDTARATAEVNVSLVTSAQQTLSLTRAKAATSVATARASLDQARASLAAANAGRAQNTVKQAQVAEAQAGVQQSQASYVQSQSELDKTFIRTPISGTVTQLAQQEGETIAAGLSAPTVIIVTDLTRLQVDVYVDETDIGQVRLGQTANVTVDAYPKRPFPGKVVKVAAGSTVQNNVVTYDVTIALDKPGNLLRPDMTATASIVVTERKQVLTVPVDAVKTGAEGASVTVMEQGPDGKPVAKVVSVKTGVSDGDRTEITSGLEEGATVVVSGTAPTSGGDGGPRMPGVFGIGSGGGGRRGR